MIRNQKLYIKDMKAHLFDCIMQMASSSGDLSLQTYAANAPITRERKLNLNLQDQMPQPYLARAIVAADPAHPNGSDGHDHNNMSVLQQHASFFDRNKDGIIYPWETFQGFRAIGCGFLLSSMAAVLLNLVLSYSTLPVTKGMAMVALMRRYLGNCPSTVGCNRPTGYLPSLLLPIYIKNIHRCKHGSDSESYDTEGRFEPTKFNAIFSKYSTTHLDALTSEELSTMLRANRNLTDFNGWILSWTEWKLLYILGKDEKGLLHRETIRAVYDGTLFERLEKERASVRKRA